MTDVHPILTFFSLGANLPTVTADGTDVETIPGHSDALFISGSMWDLPFGLLKTLANLLPDISL